MKTEADAAEVKRGSHPAGFVEIDGTRFEIDPPNATYPEPRTARLELAITAATLHPGNLPE